MRDDNDNVTIDLLEHHDLDPLAPGAQEPAPALVATQEPSRRGRGRPAKHASAAEKQRAYRARLKAAGFREVRVLVKDGDSDNEIKPTKG